MIFKLHKALYGLKQAPRAWYEILHNYLVQIGSQRTNDKQIALEKIFIDDTIFTGNDDLCNAFLEEMGKEFEMSMFGEIKLLVGLQIQQKKDGIYITQSKYIKEILKKYRMEDSRLVGNPMSTGHKLSKNDESKEVDQTT